MANVGTLVSFVAGLFTGGDTIATFARQSIQLSEFLPLFLHGSLFDKLNASCGVSDTYLVITAACAWLLTGKYTAY